MEIVLPAYPLVDMYNMQHGGWRRLSRQRNIYSLWRHRRSCAVAQETHSHIETTICNVPAMAPMAVTDSDICAPLSPYHSVWFERDVRRIDFVVIFFQWTQNWTALNFEVNFQPLIQPYSSRSINNFC